MSNTICLFLSYSRHVSLFIVKEKVEKMNNEYDLNINNGSENESRGRTLSMEAQCNSSVEINTSSSSSLSSPVGSLSIGTIVTNELRSLNDKFTTMGDKMDRVGNEMELLANKVYQVVDDIQSLVRFVRFGIVSLFYLILILKANTMICLGDICCVYNLYKNHWLIITWLSL